MKTQDMIPLLKKLYPFEGKFRSANGENNITWISILTQTNVLLRYMEIRRGPFIGEH